MNYYDLMEITIISHDFYVSFDVNIIRFLDFLSVTQFVKMTGFIRDFSLRRDKGVKK